MSSIPAPDIFRDTLDEYTTSTNENNMAQQLRQQKAASDQAIAASKQAQQQSAQGFPTQQAQQQELLKQQQLENQQKTIGLQQQQAAIGAQKASIKRDSSGKVIGFDNAGYQQRALDAGVPLGAVTAQQQALTEAQTKAEALTTEQLKNHEAELDQHFDKIEALRKIPSGPDRELAYQSMLHKDAVSGKDISDYPTTVGDDASVDQIEAHLGMTKQALNQAKEQSEINKNNQTTSQARLEAKYLDIQQRMGLKQPVTPEEKAFSQAWEHNKLLTPVATFNLQNAAAKGDQADAVVNAVANGHMKIQDAIPMRAPVAVRQQFLAKVLQANPDFKSYDNEVDKKIIEDLTSGGKSNTLLAYNTALRHADVFSKVADALDNGDVRALNSLGNVLGTQFGSDKATNFGIAKTLFADEFAKAATGANVGVTDREKTQELLSSASSPAQFKGAVATAKALLAGKRDAMMEQAKQGLQGKADFGQGETGKIRARDPKGVLHEAPAGTPLPPGWKAE